MDVAARAGVSIASVSRHLRGHNVRRAEAIDQAVAALAYRPSIAARSLQSGVTRTIGVVVPDIVNPYFAAVVKGAELVSRGAAYTLVLCNTDEDPRREAKVLESLDGRIDGLLLGPVTEHSETTEGLRQMGIPIVLIDRRVGTPMGFDCVLVDNHGGARRAIEYLVGLGHRRIGLISGPLESTPGRERHEGATSALKDAGIEQEPDLIQIGDFRTPGGYQAALRLLALSCPPTAIFAANNMMTVGALRAFHDTRVRVPGELSFVGFDDLLLGELLEPGLTCVDRPMEEQGALAMRLLLGSLDGRPASEPRQIIMETTLKVRGSCGPPRGSGVVRFGDGEAAAPGRR
jgi:LacI family transcriptional regulator